MFHPAQDSSVWLRLTSREQLIREIGTYFKKLVLKTKKNIYYIYTYIYIYIKNIYIYKIYIYIKYIYIKKKYIYICLSTACLPACLPACLYCTYEKGFS